MSRVSRSTVKYHLASIFILLFLAFLVLPYGNASAEASSTMSLEPISYSLQNVTLASRGDIHIDMTVLDGPPINLYVMDAAAYAEVALWGNVNWYSLLAYRFATSAVDDMHTGIIDAGEYCVIFDNSNLSCYLSELPDAAATIYYQILVEEGESTDPNYQPSFASWSQDHVRILWNGPYFDGGSAIIGYEIYREPDVEGSFPVRVSPDVRNFDDYDVTAGETYNYLVRSFNAHGSFEGYDPLIVVVPPQPIAQPTDFAVESVGDYLQLSWTAPHGSEKEMDLQYRLEYSDMDRMGPTEIQWHCFPAPFSDGSSSCTYQMHRSWFSPGHEYHFSLFAMTDDGDSPPSNEVAMAPLFIPGPMWEDVVIVNWGDGYIDLSWPTYVDDGGSPLTSFDLVKAWFSFEQPWYMEGQPQPTLLGWENITLPGDAMGFYDDNVTNGAYYIYSIRATNIMGQSEPTGRQIRPGTPATPIDFSAVQDGGKVRLTWTAPENDGGGPITGYILRVGQWSSGNYYPSGYRYIYVSGDVTECEDKEAIPWWEQTYSLIPCNQLGGEGVYPAYASCWVSSSWARPDAPKDFNVEYCVSEYLGNGLYFNMTLQSAGAASECRIYYYDEIDPSQTKSLSFNIYLYTYPTARQSFYIGTQWLIGVLTGGHTYHLYATTVNDVGEGPGSEEFIFTLYMTPGSVQDMQAVWDAGQVTITWAAPSDGGGKPLLGYHLKRYHFDLGNYTYDHEMNITFGPSAVSYTDDTLGPGIQCDYVLYAFNELGDGRPYSVWVKIGAPGMVENPSTVSGDGYVLVKWQPPLSDGGHPVAEYHVAWNDYAEGASGIESVAGDHLSFNHTAVNGHYYSYSVTAFNPQGGEGLSCNVFGEPRAAPGAVTDLQARWQLNEAGNPIVVLTWAPLSENDTSSRIFIYKSGGMFIGMTMTQGGSETSFIDDAVSANETYSYFLRLKSGDMQGPCTPILFITPLRPMDAPQGVLAVPGRGFVNISWSAPANSSLVFTGYSIYRAEGNSSPFLIARTTSGICNFNDTSVVGGRSYSYLIKADGVASGNGSEVVRVRAGGLAAAESSPAGFSWPLLLVLVVAAVICLAIAIYLPWRRMRKAMASVLVVAVAVMIVLVAAMAPVSPQTSSASSEATFHAGDFFIFGLNGPNGIGTIKATVIRVGDTTATWNFTQEMPGQGTISQQETMPLNHTVGYAMSLMNMSMGTSVGAMEVVEVRNETMATQWGYLAVQHRILSADVYGMTMKVETWSAGEALLCMEYCMDMMGIEMRMRLLRLVDTNMPSMVGGID